ncbi:MAG: glutamate--tRNA ligase [Actinomycetota bacterium]
MAIRMRFAPSPTGGLHIGTARTALFNWLAARSMDGELILRIEDTDIKRSEKVFEESIVGDLKWLKIDWDAFYRQSERLKLYSDYAQRLLESGAAYRCFCSPERLKELKEAQYAAGQDSRYDNRCRNLSPEEIDEKLREGRGFAIRFKVPPKKEIVFDDLIRDKISFQTAVMGDFVIIKSDGTPSYNFAVVVDDADMGISHVIRGEDHVSNTGRQILLFESLGLKLPDFAHLSMILGPDGSKLSKRHGATTISQFRDMGYLADAIGNYLSMLSWSPPREEEIFTIEQAAGNFSLSGVSKSPAIFDTDKLNWINGNHIRRLSSAKLLELAVPFLSKKGVIGKGEIKDPRSKAKIKKAVEAYQNKIKSLSELGDLLGGLFEEKIEEFEKEAVDILSKDSSAKVVELFLAEMEKRAEKKDLSEQEAGDIIKGMQNRLKSDKIKGKLLYMPIRASVTGKTHGPELPKIISILGPGACIERIKQTREFLKKDGAD